MSDDNLVVDRVLVIGGIEGKDLDRLAQALVDEVPEDRRQYGLRYVLEQALRRLNQEASGKGTQ